MRAAFFPARARGPERVFDQAARESNPVRFSSYVLLCLSHLVRARGHGEETTTTTTTTTRFRRAGAPCHHRAQGSSVNPFGYPPLSDLGQGVSHEFLSSDAIMALNILNIIIPDDIELNLMLLEVV